MKYKILLMGPQGSGKGTQAEFMTEFLNIPAFGMGELIREEIASGSELGKKFFKITDKGNLISDQDAADLLKKRLREPDVVNGYILDGYPRNLEQMKAFNFDTPTHLIIIDVPKEESLERISTRLTCESCSKVYSMKNGYRIGDACECGGKLIQRYDDTKEAVERRLEIYKKDTQPVIEQYEKMGILHRIDGLGTPEEVKKRIMKIFD